MTNHRVAMKKARRNAGYSQEALAKKVGLSRQAINMIETGSGGPSLRNAMRISKVLGRSVEDLFGDSVKEVEETCSRE